VGESLRLLLVVFAIAAYMTLAACFMVAVETRRFTTRGLLVATTAAAIMTGLLIASIRAAG
jgi:hypothetical protein